MVSLGHSHNFVFQEDNDSKHAAKLTEKWLTDNEIDVLYWPSQSPIFNPIYLWKTLKIKVDKRNPQNIKQLEEFY